MSKTKTIFLTLLLAAAALFAAPAMRPAEAKLSSDDARSVWGRVARATNLTKLPFSVKDDKTPNAWVTNGSSVTVTTGLLDVLDSQSELYGVFAHEAGHAKLGHYNSSVSHATGLSIAATLLGHFFGDVVGTAANVGANLANSGWSREQEVEADDYAVKLAASNGEDPVGLYRALTILSKINKTEPSGFNSHPPDDRRLLHIKNTIRSIRPNTKFPDDSAKSETSKSEPQTETVKNSSASKSGDGHYDVNAALDRMKKDEAEQKKNGGGK